MHCQYKTKGRYRFSGLNIITETDDLKADPTKLVRLIKRRKNGSWGMAGKGADFYFTINPNFYQDPNF